MYGLPGRHCVPEEVRCCLQNHGMSSVSVSILQRVLWFCKQYRTSPDTQRRPGNQHVN